MLVHLVLGLWLASYVLDLVPGLENHGLGLEPLVFADIIGNEQK